MSYNLKNVDVLDNWQIPDEPVQQPIPFDTKGMGCIYHEPIDAKDSVAYVRVPYMANIPGVIYEII